MFPGSRKCWHSFRGFIIVIMTSCRWLSLHPSRSITYRLLFGIRVTYVIDLLKGSQRNFSKRVPSFPSKPYAERFTNWNIDTRRLRGLEFDHTFYYKALNYSIPFDPNSFLLYIFHSCVCMPTWRSYTETNQLVFPNPLNYIFVVFLPEIRCLKACDYQSLLLLPYV